MNEEYPEVYAVVLNYNGFDDTGECVDSLLKSNLPLKIVLVDNNSIDDSYQKLETLFPKIKFIKSEKNLGYAGGMNLGIKYALEKHAEYILLVNHDVVVTPDFLKPMLSKFSEDNSTGIVSSKVLYKDDHNTIYCAGGRISKLLCTGVAEYQGLNKRDYANDDREITLAEGCFLLVKKDVFRKLGLLNEKFFMYLEDTEFSERVRKFFKIYYASKSVVYHKSGAGKSWSQFTPLYNYYYTRNRLWFYEGKLFREKLYVFFLSILITIVKTISIIFKGKKESKKSLKALWSGFLDGTKLLLGLNKTDIKKPDQIIKVIC